jgi:hypothetical protein
VLCFVSVVCDELASCLPAHHGILLYVCTNTCANAQMVYNMRVRLNIKDISMQPEVLHTCCLFARTVCDTDAYCTLFTVTTLVQFTKELSLRCPGVQVPQLFFNGRYIGVSDMCKYWCMTGQSVGSFQHQYAYCVCCR